MVESGELHSYNGSIDFCLGSGLTKKKSILYPVPKTYLERSRELKAPLVAPAFLDFNFNMNCFVFICCAVGRPIKCFAQIGSLIKSSIYSQ